jgi:NADH-quinone oxidoreductase subunit L
MAAWLIATTLLLPWLGAFFVWVIGDRRPRLQHGLAAGFAVAAGLSALGLLGFTSDQPALVLPLGGLFGDISFTPDGLGAFLAAVATVIGSLAVIFSIDYMHGEAQLGRYYAFILLFIGAMVGLALSNSLLFLFFFWEITALCSYALISFYNDDPKAVAGGVKALIITQLGGIGLLLGALLAYAYLGTYEIDVFLARAGELPPHVLALMAFGGLAAAAAKSAQVPFQTWLPDAMEAPTPVSALIHAATMVNAGVYLLARFYPAFADVPGWKTTVLVVGAVTALLAALMALVAHDLKRVLAYSTVSQLGYMVYAIGAGGIFASQFHLFSHAVFKALLFLGAGAVIHTLGTRDMRQMGGLSKHMPIVCITFIIGALALAGLPILNGFWSKEAILEAGLAGGPAWALALMILGAGLTALYTFRFVYLVFFNAAPMRLHLHDAGPAMRVSLVLLALGSLTTWLAAGPFSRLLETTLPYHPIHALSTFEIAKEIISAPITWLAMLVIGLGLGLWWQRGYLTRLTRRLEWFRPPVEAGFGFEFINRLVVFLTGGLAQILRRTQTGQLTWNIIGIVAGLAAVLALLTWSVK